MEINPKGFWENEIVEGGHYDDHILSPHLINFLKEENAASIVDFGCGNGFYVNELIKAGLNASGFDGNPNTPKITHGLCGIMDLSIVKQQGPFDWVISFEVGEHLPKEYEDSFITNLHINNKKGIILSWAVKGQGGTGHYNRDGHFLMKNNRLKILRSQIFSYL